MYIKIIDEKKKFTRTKVTYTQKNITIFYVIQLSLRHDTLLMTSLWI